jgi:hypothetical protein
MIAHPADFLGRHHADKKGRPKRPFLLQLLTCPLFRLGRLLHPGRRDFCSRFPNPLNILAGFRLSALDVHALGDMPDFSRR